MTRLTVADFPIPESPIIVKLSLSPYHVTTSLNVLSQHFDILAEPPYGPKSGVTKWSKLGFVKASGHRKSLVTTAFL